MAQRSLESYNRHLEEKVAHCSQSWIVLRDNSQMFPSYVAIPKKCGSNFCAICRADNLRRIRRTLYRTMRKDRWRLVTLTFPKRDIPAEDILSSCYSLFRKFTMRLHRKAKNVKYIRTLEIHKDSYPHLHCVFNQYVPYAFLKKAWSEVGGGIVDIRASRKCEICAATGKCEHHPNKTRMNYKQAARYLTEEMDKLSQDPHLLGYPMWRDRIQTITTSRNFKLKSEPGHYTFCGMHKDLYDAMVYYRQLEEEAWQNDTPEPRYTDNGQALFIQSNTAEPPVNLNITMDWIPPNPSLHI